MLDKIKIAVAVVLIAGGITGFYYYADYALLYRVLGLLAVVVMAVLVILTTQMGIDTWKFGRSAVVEVRKSVWPTRKETVQTTLIVMVMVIIVGLVLWGFDTFLLWAVTLLTRQGS